MAEKKIQSQFPPKEIRDYVKKKTDETFGLNDGNLDKQSFSLGMVTMWYHLNQFRQEQPKQEKGRDLIFQIINEEREYQIDNEDKENSHIVSSLNMGGILTAIQYNLSKAQSEWYSEKTPYHKTTDLLRKIAALVVRAGEDYGLTKRGKSQPQEQPKEAEYWNWVAKEISGKTSEELMILYPNYQISPHPPKSEQTKE